MVHTSGIALALLLFSAYKVDGYVCPDGWLNWSPGASCYKIVSSSLSKSWSDARFSCNNYQGDLVVINSAQEQSWLTSQLKMMGLNNTVRWWYGANKKNDMSPWAWIDGTQLTKDVVAWAKNQPDNNNDNEHCAQIAQDGFHDSDCERGFPYVCERPKNITLKCDIDKGWDKYHDTCYKLFKDQKTWSEAHDTCGDEGGSLITSPTDSIERYLVDLAKDNKQNVWIGLRSVPESAGSKWRWADMNTPLFFDGYWAVSGDSAFRKGQENSSCAEIEAVSSDLNAWSKADCTQRKAFVCERPAGVCAAGWVQHRAKCYEIKTNLPLSWPQAAAYCRAHGKFGTLVEINSQLEQSFLNKYLAELSDTGIRQVWIGLTDNNKGTFEYSSGAELRRFTNWATVPQDTAGRLDCGTIWTGNKYGKWSTTSNCLQLTSFICQLPTDVAVIDVTTLAPTLSCDEGWVLYDNQCFLFNDTAVDWLEAQSSCQGFSGTLAIIHSNYTQAFLNGHMSSAMMWISLNDRVQEGTFTFADESTVSFSNWFTGFPKAAGDTNCVGMIDDGGEIGQWKDVKCTERNGFVCQKAAVLNGQTVSPQTPPTIGWSPRCGVNWEEEPLLGYCYSFQDTTLSWPDASQWCTHNGGQLASITSIQEQYFIVGRLRSLTSFAVWIGANDIDDEGGWQWTDGSAFAYLNWKPGEPNGKGDEDCVNIVVRSGFWNDYLCSARNGFVCKKSNGVGQTTNKMQYTTPRGGVTLGCPDGWKAYVNNCYIVRHERLSRDGALSRCHQMGGDLVSIGDSNEQNFVSSLLKSSGQYWIGLDDLEIEWTYRWTDRSKVTFTSWSKGEPNNFKNNDEDCVTMYGYGKHGWNDIVCNYRAAGFVCKSSQIAIKRTTTVPGCPKNSYLYNGRCYVYVEQTEVWNTAEKKCKAMGGHLASISNSYVQAYLSSELFGKPGLYWIGLSDVNSPGTYHWTSKDSLSFTFWDRSHTGLERNTCVAMRTDKPVGLWKNDLCFRRHGYICQVAQGGTTPTPATTKTTVPPVRCASSWNEYKGFCYKAFYNPNNKDKLMWSEARSNCRSYGGELVSLRDKAEQDFVQNKLFGFFQKGDYWVGLSARDASKGYHWTDDTPFAFTNWAPHQPDNHNDMENCVAYSSRSKNWFDVNCFVAHNWICKLKKGTVIPTTFVPPTAVTSVSCGGPDSKWKYYQNMCYYVSVGEKKSWYEARDWCREHGAELASIANKAENKMIQMMTAKLSYLAYWIGLNSLDLHGYEWSDNTVVNFISWALNEPNDGFGGQKCVNFYNTQGAWNDDNCNDKNEFICKKVNGSYSPIPPEVTTIRPGNCPKGFHGFKSKCFFLGGNTKSTQMNWTASRDKCRAFGEGYEIATIQDAEEQAFVTTLLRGWNTSVWIGLNDLWQENQFEWQDNARVSYVNWAKGEPSGGSYMGQEDCVHIYSEENLAGKWNDESCSRLLGYVCQVYKSTAFSSPKPTSLPSWCKPGYTLIGQNCYKIKSTLTTWSRAKALCELEGSNLVSITDVFEQAAVRVMTRNVDQSVWLGLHDAEVSGTYEWVDGWPVLYTNWAQGEPTKDDGEGCVALLPDGMWNDTKCKQAFFPVCKLTIETPPPVTTPKPGHCKDKTWERWGDSCFYVELKSKTSWPEARFECERKGMTLVSIRTRFEHKFVTNLVNHKQSYGSKNVWIGLLKGLTTGFLWIDNTYVDYVSWEQGEPSDVNGTDHEDCVELHGQTGHWNDLPCNTDRGYVCKTLAVGVPTTFAVKTAKSNMPTTPSVTLATGKRSSPLTSHIRWTPPTTISNGHRSGPPLSNPGHSGSSGLSAGAVVGICLGVLLTLVGIAATLIVIKRRQGFIYKIDRPTTGFNNAIYSTTGDPVDIQSDTRNINGHVQSSSTFSN